MAETRYHRAPRPMARWPVVCLAVFFLVSCTISAVSVSAPATPTGTSPAIATPSAIPTLDHAQMLAQLRPAASLQDAGEQCAALIGRAADAARVRIETPKEQECVPCNRLPIDSLSRGVPIGEIRLPLEPVSWVWVTVGDLLCVYLYDGREFKPSSVTHW